MDLFRKRLNDDLSARSTATHYFNTATHYFYLGVGKRNKGDLDGAIADYNRAIELDSKYAPAYYNRGLAKRDKDDLNGAMADYNHAIELDSKDASAYNSRGNAKTTKDDLDGAMADFNRVIELNSKDASAYRARARLFFETQNWNGAVSDFRRCCELDARDQDYPRLDIWLVRSRLGESVTANAELDEFVRKRWNAAPGDWVSTIARYLLGKVSEADLFAAAKSPDAKKERSQLCEAWFYAGMKKLFARDKAAAAEYFNKCLATEQKHFVEYEFARSELKALRK